MIDSRFFFQRNFEILFTSFACTLISCCSIVNDPRGFHRYSVPCFAQPDYYITTVRICQGVFQNFFKFFDFLSSRFPLTPCRADVKHIISHSVHFVKYLFKSFFNFFRDFLCAVSLAVARSLTACIL